MTIADPGFRFYDWRISLGLTLEQAAKVLGIPVATARFYDDNKVCVTPVIVFACKFLAGLPARDSRSKPLTCANCRFWGRGSAGNVGECRRNAPTTFIPDYAVDDRDGQRFTSWARWPATHDSDWCGDLESAQ